MSPWPALRISGTAARIGQTVPATFVSSIVVSASSLWSRMLAVHPDPRVGDERVEAPEPLDGGR